MAHGVGYIDDLLDGRRIDESGKCVYEYM